MRSRPLVAAGVALMVTGVVLAGFALAGTTPGGAPGGGGVAAVAPDAVGRSGSATSPNGASSSPSSSGATSKGGSSSARGAAASTSRAVWIALPSLGIRSRLHPDGLSANGTISPPAGHVIWFTGYGRVMPGRVGTSVVAGHVVADGKPDVFNRLPDLARGSTVRVGYADGAVLTMKVVRTAIVNKTQLQRDPDVWGNNGTTRRIALITCDDAMGFRSDGHRVANFVAIAEPA